MCVRMCMRIHSSSSFSLSLSLSYRLKAVRFLLERSFHAPCHASLTIHGRHILNLLFSTPFTVAPTHYEPHTKGGSGTLGQQGSPGCPRRSAHWQSSLPQAPALAKRPYCAPWPSFGSLGAPAICMPMPLPKTSMFQTMHLTGIVRVDYVAVRPCFGFCTP